MMFLKKSFTFRQLSGLVGVFGLIVALTPSFATAGELERFADSSRLITIGGAITEIVYRLGEEGRLIARDTTSVYPPEALKLPDVGYMRALSPEGVLSLAPSAILAAEDSGPLGALDVLKKADVPMIMIPNRYDRDGILEKIRIIGAALGVEDKARALAREVDAELKAVETAARANAEARPRVLFILSLRGGRILAAGRDTRADGIIRMAGGINVMASFSGYKQASEESLLKAQPDAILMMATAHGHDIAEEALFAHPAIAASPAGRNRALIRMDGAWLLDFGPRTASAVRALQAKLGAIMSKKATDE